jgi:hypothetical protein
LRFEDGFRVDLLVEGAIVVEIKSVEALHPVPFEAGIDLFAFAVSADRASYQLWRPYFETGAASDCERFAKLRISARPREPIAVIPDCLCGSASPREKIRLSAGQP